MLLSASPHCANADQTRCALNVLALNVASDLTQAVREPFTAPVNVWPVLKGVLTIFVTNVGRASIRNGRTPIKVPSGSVGWYAAISTSEATDTLIGLATENTLLMTAVPDGTTSRKVSGNETAICASAVDLSKPISGALTYTILSLTGFLTITTQIT